MNHTETITTKKNSLAREAKHARQLGFTVPANGLNPYMLLEDNMTIIWMAGELFTVVTTTAHFGTGQHRKTWKSSGGNKPNQTMSSTQLDSDGIGRHTEIYYREVCKGSIREYASLHHVPESSVMVDHKDHDRANNTIDNLYLCMAWQNNLNRGEGKDHTFYTLDDVKAKLASGEWRPLKK